MDCRTTSAHKFRTKLRFKQYDVILTKHQSVLTKIMNFFKGENMQMHLGCRINLDFHDLKRTIETDENGHSNKGIDYKIKRHEAIQQELDWKFIRIDPDKEELSMKYLDTSNNLLKSLISKVSTRL